MKNFSESGVAQLKLLEGYRSTPYKDRKGCWTIGYGHKIKPGEVFTFLDKESASKLLMRDVEPIVKFLNIHLCNSVNKINLSQNQLDALVILIFNIGEGAFLTSTIFQALKDNKPEEAVKPWKKWINVTEYVKDMDTGKMIKKLVPVEGLINRRAVEISMFST